MKIGQRYLKIENGGLCPSECFTVLGASLADTCIDESKRQFIVGAFGSGCKYSIALMLRKNVYPIVFLGSLKMEYFVDRTTIKDEMNSKNVDRISVKYSGKTEDGKTKNKIEQLSMTTDFGSANWQHISLALREFISNSIDFSIRKFGNWDNVDIGIVEERQVRAKSGSTRIFIPLTREVEQFYYNLDKWFLHFSEPENLLNSVLEKKDRNFSDKRTAVIYRRGVFIREIDSQEEESLFDYNLRDLPLDESRQSDNWQVKYYSGVALAGSADENVQQKYLKNINNTNWENTFDNYSWNSQSVSSKERWRNSYEKVYANQVLCTGAYAERVIRKGFHPNIVSEQCFGILDSLGIKTHKEILSANELDGLELVQPTEEMVRVHNQVWRFLVRNNLSKGVEQPELYSYSSRMDAGSVMFGFYRDGGIYIKNDVSGPLLFKVMFEEYCHAVTKASDLSRDLQHYMLDIIYAMSQDVTGV